MKWINKTSAEPKCLTELRATPSTSYSSLHGDCSALIRYQLLNEQGHLCAYCMQRISEEKNPDQYRMSIEIEHFKAQAGNSAQALDYKNMLAVCNGFSKQKIKDNQWREKEDKVSHCDKTEGGKGDGNENLRALDPRVAICEQMIKYSTTGKIEAVDDNKKVTFDIEKMLNLNIQKLVEARKGVLDKAANRLRDALPKNISKPLPKTVLKSEINYWTEPKIEIDLNGNKNIYYKPFCQVAIWYLKKKMNKAE